MWKVTSWGLAFLWVAVETFRRLKPTRTSSPIVAFSATVRLTPAIDNSRGAAAASCGLSEFGMPYSSRMAAVSDVTLAGTVNSAPSPESVSASSKTGSAAESKQTPVSLAAAALGARLTAREAGDAFRVQADPPFELDVRIVRIDDQRAELDGVPGGGLGRVGLDRDDAQVFDVMGLRQVFHMSAAAIVRFEIACRLIRTPP